jgi:hypothetical protein
MIDERNSKLAETGNLMIEMDAEVYEAFKSSTQISSKYNVLHIRVKFTKINF